MTETSASPVIRLWTPDGFREDEWVHAESADALAGNRRVILPLAAYLALEPEAREAAKERIGVLLQPAEAVDAIVPFLPSLALVALAFPAFNDGRSFSKAELLRRRHGYHGPLRAVGQVLIDQIPHMLRTGFTELEVSNETALKRLEAGKLTGLPLYYQPAAKPAQGGEKYSWRRRPAA
jgi:uncharacterized protein (DUF934 family)